MWRNIESCALKILQSKIKNNVKGEYFIVGAVLFVNAALMIKLGINGEPITLIFGILSVAAVIFMTAVIIVSYARYNKFQGLVGIVKAEYTEAVFVRKYTETSSRSSPEKNYFIRVKVDGRKINAVCTRKAYKERKKGNTVYIIDFIGKQGAYPQFCVAVADIDNYIGCAYMNMNEMLEDVKKVMKQLDNLKTFRFVRLTGDIDSVSKMPYYQQEKDKLELYARELNKMRNAKVYCENEDNAGSFLFQKELNEIKKIDTHLNDIAYRNILETENMIHDILSHNSDF